MDINIFGKIVYGGMYINLVIILGGDGRGEGGEGEKRVFLVLFVMFFFRVIVVLK